MSKKENMRKEKRTHIKYVLVMCLLIGLASVSYAETVPIDIESTIERALEVNLDMKKGSYDLKKAKIGKFSSWNVLVPTISAGGSLSRLNEEVKATPAIPEPDENDRWSLSRSISVSVPLAGRLAQNAISVVIPYKSYESGKISYERLMSETVKNVQLAYINLFIAKQTLDYRRERLKLDEYKAEDAKEAFDSGLKDEYSYLQTQLAVANSRQQLSNQENTYQQLSEEMEILLDYPLGTEFEFLEELEDFDVLNGEEEDVYDEYLHFKEIDNNYQVRLLLVQQEINKLNRMKNIFGFFPSISLGWQQRYQFQEKPIGEDKSWVGDHWGDDLGSLSLSLSVPLSEYHPWSSTAVRVREFNQDIEKNKLELELTEKKQTQELLAAQRSLAAGLESVRVQKETIELAERNAELAEEAYRGGLMKHADYQDAVDALDKARIDKLLYQKAVYESLLHIQIILGKDLLESRDK